MWTTTVGSRKDSTAFVFGDVMLCSCLCRCWNKYIARSKKEKWNCPGTHLTMQMRVVCMGFAVVLSGFDNCGIVCMGFGVCGGRVWVHSWVVGNDVAVLLFASLLYFYVMLHSQPLYEICLAVCEIKICSFLFH